MNSAPSDRTSDKYKLRWSKARQATDRLCVRWSISDVYDIELKVGDDTTSNRRTIFRTIRKHLRKNRTQSLRDHPIKEKLILVWPRQNPAATFLQQYTTFKDWSFVHRARLGIFNNINAYNKGVTQIKSVANAQTWKPWLMCSTTAWYIVHFIRKAIMQWFKE